MSDKVIIASFGKTRTARTATQYQYNHGQKLQFENVDLPANYEVHFSNSVNGEAKTRMGDSTGVVIPPEYFVPGSTIYAWIYVTDEDSGITIRKVEIPISVKAKPTDQPLEPEDESLVEQVVNRLNETIDEIPNKIDQALEDAKESGEFNGPKGDPFTYDDFTPEQLEGLKGPKGDSFIYDDFTPEQLEGLKGPKGDSFTYDDFTPEELEELTGPQGPEGSTIWTTNTPYSYSQETGRYYFAASNLRGPTNATKKLYDLVYLSDDTNKEYKAFYIVEFQYGGLQVGCRYLADMQGPPGEGATGAVLYSKAQALSESEKNRARQNIGAASISDLGVVFRLKGDVASVSDLPSTGNTPGDVYYVRAKQVGYVWLETQFNPDGYWEELGEPIDISNLPNTITWFTGTVDANDNFIPGEYLTIQNLVIAISNNRLPIVAISFSDGTIIKLPLLHYSFTNSASDYFVFYTVTSNPSKARLQPIKPLSEFYRISYYKELAAGGTLVWHRKYDHGYFVEHETIGDLSDLNTTDKSSIVNAINELVASGSSDVAVFDFIISLENDEYVITQNPEYDDVYTAFEDGKIVIAKIRRINDSIWTDYCFIGTLEEAHDSTGGSVIYFSGETGPGNYFIIRGGKSGSVINGWEVVIDNSIWSAVDELESEISEKYTKPGSGIPASDLASDVQTSLGKADTALQSFIETDPTVSSWAKAPNKPNYTASEVGAIPVPDNIFDEAIPIYDANSGIWDRDDINGLLYGSSARVILIRGGNYTGEDVMAIEENPADVLSYFTSNRKTIFVYVQLDGSYIFLTPFYGDETTGEVRFNHVEGYIVREWIFRPEMVNGSLYLICHHNNGGYHRYDIPSTASDVGAVASNQGVSNANKVLTVNSYGNVVPEDKRFVVTLTPTAQDMSGVMDKTVAEIYAAYKAGKKVVFKVLSGVNEATYADCTMQYDSGSYTYPSFNGFIISNFSTPNIMIFAFTSSTNDGTKATYATRIYPLASGQWTGGSY